MRNTIILLFAGMLFSQIILAQPTGEILMTIGDEEITSAEFLRIYNKNNSIENQIDPKSMEEYLDLFINFKLKVLEAESLGMDTLPSFKRELAGYQEQLTKPYLRDDSYDDQLIKEAYERTKQEVNASHIMIRLDEFAPPKDTLEAYNKIMAIRDRILGGEDFESVARATSDDPSAKQNGGNLGYFSAFRMVYPFENAAYNTPVGDISMPVRTRFGYHLVKVNDKRPSRGKIQASHIMVATPQGMTAAQIDSAKSKVERLQQRLENGEDFQELARQYSDDKGSGRNGGILPTFSSGQMVPEFEDAAFSLSNDGEITSEPVRTQYGWHLIQRISKEDIPEFDEIRGELAEKVRRDQRNKAGQDSFIANLKEEYNFKVNKEVLAEFYTLVDSSIFNKKWTPDYSELNQTLFVLNGESYNQDRFAAYLESQKPSRPVAIPVYVDMHFDRFTEEEIIAYEKTRLPEKYPEYRYLMEEYHDGILLFDLTDKLVWSKAVQDTAGLEAFYEKHKSDYLWGERADAVIFTLENELYLNDLQKTLKKALRKGFSPEKIKTMVCDTSDCLTFDTGLYEKGDNDMVDQLSWEKGIGDPVKTNETIKIVYISQVLPPQPKALSEARGIITSDYQSYLEKQWIEKLREKYTIKVNEDVLSKIKQD
ncbi:MAG: peptidylprolyl isomerase [Bacteroidota bacterium]